MTDFSTVTACGECCAACPKKLDGRCPGCMEADGRVPEWAESGRCRVHACTREHHVPFCGLCAEFPCGRLPEMIPWNPGIVGRMTALRDEYSMIRPEHGPLGPEWAKRSSMKKCEPGDLPRILDFYQFVIRESSDVFEYARWVYGRHPTEEKLTEYVRQGMLYYTEEGTDVTAAVAVTPYQTDEYHGVGWQAALKDDEVAVAHLLAVNPRFRSRGCAKTMMREVVSLAKSKGLKAVRLDALACNIPANRLYESLGFQKRGVCRWYAENTGWFDFYLFEYLL